MRRALRLCVIGLLELIAVAVALALIVSSAAAWKLSRGPVDLDFLRNDVQRALAELFGGDLVALGGVQAAWSTAENGFVLALTDVAVAKSGGEVIAASARLEAGLRVDALLGGRLAFSRLATDGGDVTITREADASWTFALGSPKTATGRVLRLKPREEPIDLAEILASLPPVVARLEAVSVSGARLHIIDGARGVDYAFDDVSLRLARRASSLTLIGSGGIAETDAALDVEARTSEGFGEAFGELRVAAAPLAAFAPSKGPLRALSSATSKIDARLALSWSAGRGVTAAEIEATATPGSAAVGGRTLDVRRFDLSSAYEPTTQSILIDALDFDIGETKGRLKGRIDALGLAALKSRGHEAPFDLEAEDLSVDLRPLFDAPLDARRLAVSGRLRAAERSAVFDRLDADVRGVEARLSGEASLVRASTGAFLPNIKLSGPIGGSASPVDVVDLWPVKLAEGARSWLRSAVIGGRIFNAKLDLDLDAEALVRQRLDDDRLALSFSFEDAAVRIVSTMSPITDASGSAVLRGNSFSLSMREGRLRGVPLRDGFVEIPRLNPRGAPARFGMTAQGPVREVVLFIDEPPLGFASEAGFDPSRLSGEGELKVELTRPMLKDVPAEDLKFTLSGRYEGVNGPGPFEGFDFRDATVALKGDETGLTADVDGAIGPIPARFVWTERFRGGGRKRTTYDLEARLDSSVLDALGAPARRFFSGEAGVRATFAGVGLDIVEARIDADLTDAALTAPGSTWTKPQGAPASASLSVTGVDGGGFAISDISVAAGGFALQGDARLAADGRLLMLAAPTVALEDSFDFAVDVARGEDDGFVVRIDGPLVDARGALGQLARSGSEGELGAPLSVTVRADTALIGPTAALTDLRVSLDHDGSKARALSVDAQGPNGPVSARLTTEADSGARRFTLEAADAGLLLEALFDSTHMRGGTARIDAELPSLDAAADAPTRARIDVSGFTLVGAPAMARILTLGSLQGLAETLAGEGIGFERLTGAVTFADSVARFDGMRAAGPSIGVTLNGDVDLKAQSVALEGVLVPAYTFNSVLGGLPIIGDILVSRKGEGVFALTYTVDGPFSAMRVFVNPLSALAPGVLRRIFEGSSTASVDAALSPPPPPETPDALRGVIEESVLPEPTDEP